MPYPMYDEPTCEHDWYQERAMWLGNLYSFATEKESCSFQESCMSADFEQMPAIFAEYGLRWNPIVEHDVTAIFNRQPVRYFKPTWAWVEGYRKAHNIKYKAPEVSIRSWDQVIEDTKGWMQQIEEQHEKHGICLWMDEMGYACYREQTYFYKTQEWQDRAAAARYEWGYKCGMCGKVGKGFHVHHTSPIVTAYHKNFNNCFSEYRIKLYCEDCHKKTHNMTVRGDGSYCYIGATPEEVAEEKEYFRKWRKAHDELKQCPFCKARGHFG